MGLLNSSTHTSNKSSHYFCLIKIRLCNIVLVNSSFITQCINRGSINHAPAARLTPGKQPSLINSSYRAFCWRSWSINSTAQNCCYTLFLLSLWPRLHIKRPCAASRLRSLETLWLLTVNRHPAITDGVNEERERAASSFFVFVCSQKADTHTHTRTNTHTDANQQYYWSRQ